MEWFVIAVVLILLISAALALADFTIDRYAKMLNNFVKRVADPNNPDSEKTIRQYFLVATLIIVFLLTVYPLLFREH